MAPHAQLLDHTTCYCFLIPGPNGAKKTSTVVPGQKLKDIARATGIKIRYDCNEGTCKTCEAKIDGRVTKVCVAKAPAKDVTIKYNIR